MGTEAKAVENIKRNAKNFRYPPEGFAVHIEHSLLYAMLSDPKHYPEDVVKERIDDEDFTDYLVVNTASSNANEDEDVISYAQLSALLALSAEKLPPKENSSDEQSSQEKLCKALLQCIVKYAEENDLDRNHEVQEFLAPVQRMAQKHESSAALSAILPFYVGYAASLITLNPIPMFVGATMTAMSDSNVGERENVNKFKKETERKADLEKTSLLDETDEF